MDENLEFHIKISYFEIYLDKIKDLLDGKFATMKTKLHCAILLPMFSIVPANVKGQPIKIQLKVLISVF